MKPGYNRNIIQIISRYSNLPEQDVKGLFRKNGVYADRIAWAKFTDLALLGIAAAFLLAGMIFFFAYNWDKLHKFVKLGMIQAMIILPVVSIWIFKPRELVKNMLITISCVLVGVLFAVFGQIYQTGADAYDLFLGWTIFIAIWALSTRFEALWIIFLVLINTTFVLYVGQAGPYVLEKSMYAILYSFNLLVVIGVQLLSPRIEVASWFTRIIIFGAVVILTIGLVSGIWQQYPPEWFVSLGLCLLSYTAGVYYSIKRRSMYLLCILPVSIIIVLCALYFERVSAKTESFIFISLVIVISITFLVRELMRLNRTWYAVKS
ncbi:DUF2157 domain-containing protein [Pedobacter heparinus]|uniref:DUF2157 domain-containing protein n=1 Tax=Pedobacter heparinus TaxID=984 RepID=UPI00292D4D06|nr:DUF2157 domain-containing protein [Pedobacter heparinus]